MGRVAARGPHTVCPAAIVYATIPTVTCPTGTGRDQSVWPFSRYQSVGL